MRMEEALVRLIQSTLPGGTGLIPLPEATPEKSQCKLALHPDMTGLHPLVSAINTVAWHAVAGSTGLLATARSRNVTTHVPMPQGVSPCSARAEVLFSIVHWQCNGPSEVV